ncbi:hypothetical protein FAGKG844_670016 [Frankia sp. AgKG'84/4]
MVTTAADVSAGFAATVLRVAGIVDLRPDEHRRPGPSVTPA